MNTPDWNRIRDHYARHNSAILAAPRNHWAIDAYAWDHEAGIRLTPIETWLWADIRSVDAVLYPQYPVGRYFLDFANPVAKVAIECDGAAFHKDEQRDALRDKTLMDWGWSVYRITGTDCRTEQDDETGEVSKAYRFVKRIAEEHRIVFGGSL